MITSEEWRKIPLVDRLIAHSNQTDDELLRDDLIAAVRALNILIARRLDLEAEIVRLERLAASVSPY